VKEGASAGWRQGVCPSGIAGGCGEGSGSWRGGERGMRRWRRRAPWRGGGGKAKTFRCHKRRWAWRVAVCGDWIRRST
jgi:hypothetical protein